MSCFSCRQILKISLRGTQLSHVAKPGAVSRSEVLPFAGGLGLFALSFFGIAISLYPTIVAPHLTLWETASSDRTQAFLLVGALVLLPTILMYTSWSYWVFRGKVRSDIGYH